MLFSILFIGIKYFTIKSENKRNPSIKEVQWTQRSKTHILCNNISVLEYPNLGVPTVAQWVKDLALLQLWCGSQLWLEFDLYPGTSIYHGCSQKRKKNIYMYICIYPNLAFGDPSAKVNTFCFSRKTTKWTELVPTCTRSTYKKIPGIF